jgi:WD40 repeat protein
MATRPLTLRQSWPGREGTALAWSADGRHFASAVRSEITVSGPALRNDDPHLNTPQPVHALVFCDDVLLAAPYRIGVDALTVLDAAGADGSEGDPSPGAIRAAAWTPDGNTAVLALRREPPRGVPARTGGPGPADRVIRVGADVVTEVWSGNAVGSLVVAAGEDVLLFADTTVRATSVAGSPAPHDVIGREVSARAVSLDPDRSRVAVGWADGQVTVCGVDGSAASTWRAHDTDALVVSWLDDRVLTGGDDGTVRLFSADGDPIAASRPRDFQPIVALAVHPDRTTVRASVGGPRAELLEFELPAG